MSLNCKTIIESALNISFSLAVRKQRYAASKVFWAKTQLQPCPQWDPEAESFSAEEIPRPYKALPQPSILGVYDLVSRSRYFFNTKAMHVEDQETMCTLRLWCPYMGQALRMCDKIFPRRLLSFVAPHVAEQTTFCYSSKSSSLHTKTLSNVFHKWNV